MIDGLDQIAFIGFGEAGLALAAPIVAGSGGAPAAYDRTESAAMREAFVRAGVRGASTNAGAVAGATLILSLVTADQALAAAKESAASIAPGAFYCDGNSVAPATKVAAARVIEAAGGHYVDVAILAPVHPQQLGVPLLLAGERAGAARAALAALGFTNIAIAGEAVGQAAAIKMIRSVLIKGIEALAAELAAAADAAGVRDAVIASLDASWKPDIGWGERIEGSLERIARHGTRRAAEMDEVAATLASLRVDNRMVIATAAKQRAGTHLQQVQEA
jgi:3-hydroxyisobutyrate dehydrogenase-like beta-hydroxyacid dehydrogenase